MPLITFVLFIFNVRMMNIPYDSAESGRGAAFKNICEVNDTFSHVLFISFYVVSALTFLTVFYFLVSTCVLLQSGFLIRAMVERRIRIMRRRDNQLQLNEAESSDLAENMFGGIL